MKNIAIILASGTGSRLGNGLPKQFIKINGKTILEHCINAFESVVEIDEIILVINPNYRDFAQKIIKNNNFKKLSKILDGGETRKDSSSIAIEAVEDNEANVLIHDCARPFVSQKIIKDCVEALKHYDAVCTAVESIDTILQTENNIVKAIPQRSSIMRAQTPQGFRLSVIKKAHKYAKSDCNFTDDCGMVVRYNLTEVHIIKGDELNLKITYPQDIEIAEDLLNQANQS